MSLVYFEGRDRNAVAIVASKIISLHQNRLPTETPVCVATTQGAIHVRGSFDDAQAKLIAALNQQSDKDFIQAVTDPENQPSQFGTVTLEMYERVQALNAELLGALKTYRRILNAGGIEFPESLCAAIAKGVGAVKEITAPHGYGLVCDCCRKWAEYCDCKPLEMGGSV